MNADEIKALRKRLGLNQTDFADTLGSSRKSVSDWENGRRKPIKMAILAMRALDQKSHRFGEDEPVYDAG